ncbi:TolC family protein [uncultured Pseudacidovorax sp.]|uniref:TolC family protein n=1 Tax=uncultured Pseudacidovorax sp. TaxID=679313 RepID=UPI0025FF23D9|nr:TolC family protein [uncultured Pseudacidovorax sp.]
MKCLAAWPLRSPARAAIALACALACLPAATQVQIRRQGVPVAVYDENGMRLLTATRLSMPEAPAPMPVDERIAAVAPASLRGATTPMPSAAPAAAAPAPVSLPVTPASTPSAAPAAAGAAAGAPGLVITGQTQRFKQSLRTLALEHPEVLAADAAAASSGFEVEAAKKARYPRFKVGTASGTYNSGRDGASSENYTLLTAEARMSLIDGGAMSARERAAEAGSRAQSEAVKTTSQKVVLDALTAYMQVQRFDLKREIARRSTRIVQDLARSEERRVALGGAGESALRMAGARRAGIAAREADFDAQLAEAIAKFDSYFRFVPDPARLPLLRTPPSWQIASQQEAIARAEARSTELTEAQERVARARELVEQQEASIWPTVEAVVVKTQDPRGVTTSEPSRAALELNWNFGSGFDRQLRVKSALAEVQNQEAKLDGVRRNLLELTASAWGRTASGREREQQLREAVAESGEAFRGRSRLLEFGRETLPNVLDAQLEHNNLLLDYIDAVFDLRVTEFRLARATGELRVEPDGVSPWVDEIVGAPARSLLGPDGLGMTQQGAPAAPAKVPAPARAVVQRPPVPPAAEVSLGGPALPVQAMPQRMALRAASRLQ